MLTNCLADSMKAELETVQNVICYSGR